MSGTDEGRRGDRIFLNNLGFFGFHGVMPEETRLGQRFFLDLTCGVDLKPAGETDQLGTTVSYAEIYDVVKKAFESKPFKLIEALAEHIAERLFFSFAGIEWVTVRVRKPEAPIPMVSGDVGIEITRWRSEAR